MRVESAMVFSILAHELRSPLGVIQGYVRMLRMRRADDDQETRMLTAMLDATGRISAVARQASELAAWQQAPPGEPTPTSLGALLQRVSASQLPRPVAMTVGDLAADTVSTWQPEALAAAIAAIVVSAQRNAPDRTIALRALRTPDNEVLLLVGVDAAVAELSDQAVPAGLGPADERLFAGGGQGLSLVLAASVLDRHGIGVGLIEPSRIVVLRLPKDRGRQ